VTVAARPHHSHAAFGDDPFGRFAEKTARFFGTPHYIVGQTQAAYAAPLILLAQTRQADRDKREAERVDERHTQLESSVKGEADRLLDLLESNTTLTRQDKELTEQVARLTQEIHALLTGRRP
jgi:uncharacterized membrane protein